MANGKQKLDPRSPFMMERLMRMWRRTGGREETFADKDEFMDRMQEFSHTALARRYGKLLRDHPRERAQDLAYRAYEAGDLEQALGLVEQALELDPECVEALTVEAVLSSEDVGELIPRLERAAAIGEKVLGQEFFSEAKGDFWSLVEARPYGRCIKQLAEVLWNVGRRLDAVAHYERLMDLDPENHLGNGVLLLGDYLAVGEVQRSWDLLEKIDDGEAAVFNWSWVLLLLMVGDQDGAREALDHALDLNSYVAPLLIGLGGDEEPLTDPTYAIGSREEAIYCLQVLGEAWTGHLSAHWWLLDVLHEMGLVTEDDAPLPEDPTTIN